ncbi:hypothetical protein [Gordonia sp. NPDC003376]
MTAAASDRVVPGDGGAGVVAMAAVGSGSRGVVNESYAITGPSVNYLSDFPVLRAAGDGIGLNID